MMQSEKLDKYLLPEHITAKFTKNGFQSKFIITKAKQAFLMMMLSSALTCFNAFDCAV